MKINKPFIVSQHQSQKESMVRELALKELEMIVGSGQEGCIGTKPLTYDWEGGCKFDEGEKADC